MSDPNARLDAALDRLVQAVELAATERDNQRTRVRAAAVLIGQDCRARFGDEVGDYVDASAREHLAAALHPQRDSPPRES